MEINGEEIIMMEQLKLPIPDRFFMSRWTYVAVRLEPFPVSCGCCDNQLELPFTQRI